MLLSQQQSASMHPLNTMPTRTIRFPKPLSTPYTVPRHATTPYLGLGGNTRATLAPRPALATPGDDVAEGVIKAEEDIPQIEDEDEQAKSDAYSEEMKAKMGGSLEYRHELGINFHQILPDLYVGSCMQTAADVQRIHKELGIGTILCLQKDSDMAYFDLDIRPIQAACHSLGIAHVRFEIRDFDPFDLRKRLPDAVRVCCEAAASGRGPLYIHCTAGLGRAPAVAMAWMHWCKGYPLQEAVTLLTSIRACNPKVQAIRQATVDVLYPEASVAIDITLDAATVAAVLATAHAGADEAHTQGNGATLPAPSTPQPLQGPATVQVAGLDVGWGQFLSMQGPDAGGHYTLHRRLAPGRYPYKFVIDGVWCCEERLPTFVDGDNVNNVVEVEAQGAPNPARDAARARIMSEEGTLTEEEAAAMAAAVCAGRPWYRRLFGWLRVPW